MQPRMVIQGFLNEPCQMGTEYSCFMGRSPWPIISDCWIFSKGNTNRDNLSESVNSVLQFLIFHTFCVRASRWPRTRWLQSG